jgi:hypothetical protein
MQEAVRGDTLFAGLPMIRARTLLLTVSLVPTLFASSAVAQTAQFLPEVDVYANVNSDVRLCFQAKETRENGNPTQAEIGPSIDFKLMKSARRSEAITSHDLDKSKSRWLVLSFGYRYLPSPDAPTVNRFIFQAASNVALEANVLLSDRNRGELNFSSGALTWRYRNRPTLQRTWAIHSYHPTTYGSAEFYYSSNYQKWSSTALYAGVLAPFGKHVQVDLYYEHENNTGKKPNQQINALGLAGAFHF